MKLMFYADLMQTCDHACAVLHWMERQVQAVRVWAWQKASHENLRTCNERAATQDRF